MLQTDEPSQVIVRRTAEMIVVERPSVAHVATLGAQPIVTSVDGARVAFTAADVLLGRDSSGAGYGQQIPCTGFGRSVIASATAAAARIALGLVIGTNVAAQSTSIAGYGITDAYTKTQVDALLAGYEPVDPDLAAIAALGTTGYLKRTAANTWALSVGLPWADVTGSPTTLAGYGILDAMTQAQADLRYQPIGNYALVGASYTTTAADARFLGISAAAANSSQLLGGTWAAPGTIGSTTPNTGKFTSLVTTGLAAILGGATNPDVLLNITGTHPSAAATVYGANMNYGVPATATTAAFNYRSIMTTAASAFTLATANHFAAIQTVLGGGSAITNVRGFYAANAMAATGATSYGFYSDINAATNTFQLALLGTAWNALNGQTGINQSTANFNIACGIGVTSNLDTNGTKYGLVVSGAFNSTTTTIGTGISSQVTTAAAAFTLTDLPLFSAGPVNKGAGSTITTVYGYWARSTIAGAGGTTYGFYSDIADASNVFAFYSSGTAASRFTGSVGIGSNNVSNTSEALRIVLPATITAGSVVPINLNFSAPATTTVAMSGIFGTYSTAAAAFTCPEVNAFRVNQFSLGAGSTVTALNGFYVNSLYTNDVAGTTVKAFQSLLNKGANATVWALYMGGSAESFFAAPISIGTTGGAGLVGAMFRMMGSQTHPSSLATITGIASDFTSPATATTAAYAFYSVLRTAATAFTQALAVHFFADNVVVGAGSTVGSAYGFHASANLGASSATNVHGFHSDIASGAGKYQLYMAGTAQSRFAGPIALIAATDPIGSGAIIHISGTHPSTTTALYGMFADLTAPATATNFVMGHRLVLRTAAAAFTLPSLRFYVADQTVVGAGSAITNIYGFWASNATVNPTVGSATYGFYSDIATPAAGSAFQIYMAGTAESVINGPLAVGTTLNANANAASLFYVGGAGSHPNTGNTIAGGKIDYTAPATATSIAYGLMVNVRTAASAFTVGSVRMYTAENVILGAGSAITAVYGYMARNAIAVSTGNNYGFYSDINVNAIVNYQMYMAGSAPSFFAGPVGIISNNPAANNALYQVGSGALAHYSTGTTAVSVYSDTVAPATMTSTLTGYQSTLRTVASAFTLTNLTHFGAALTVLGATSTITTVRGFHASNSIAVGTNNYGFYSDLANSGTSTNYALFFNGTAESFIKGSVSIQNAGTSQLYYLGCSGTHANTGVSLYGLQVDITAPATNTNVLYLNRALGRTAASAFTLGTMTMYYAEQVILGAGSTITNVHGFFASASLTGKSTNAYAFYTDFAAATNVYAFYGNGTADSSFGGGVLCRSASSGIGYATGAGGTVTQATSKATGVTLSKNCGQITLNAASLAAATIVSFVVTNTSVAAGDLIHVQHQSGGTLGAYGINARAAAGSFTVDVRNNTAAALAEAIVLSFAVIKGVTA